MQKYIDKGSELQIRSAIALDHLKNYIYVEANKVAHIPIVLAKFLNQDGRSHLNTQILIVL